MPDPAVSVPRHAMRRAKSPILAGLMLIAVTGVLCAATDDFGVIDAVKNGDLAALHSLLDRRVNVNQRGPDGATAIHWAAYYENQQALDMLIRSGGDVNSRNDLGVTALWLATSQASGSIVAKLLDAGADPNLSPSTGGTALMLASRHGDAISTRLLLDHAAHVNATEGANGQTALMWAIAERHSELVGLLLDRGASVRARSHSSRRVVLLCCPAWSGDPEGTVEIDQGGLTPLLFTALNGDTESARRLLDAGADVNDTAAAGTTALVMAAHRGFTPLVTLLLERGADPNAAGGGYTALHSAALRGDQNMVRMLLAHAASPNSRLTRGTFLKRGSREFAFDKRLVGATPFLLAARLGNLALMRLLVDAGTDPAIRLEDGRTPLMVAAQGETTGARVRGAAEPRVLEAVKLLIALGADVNALDGSGNSALHLLSMRRPAFDSVIQLLADHGAALDSPNAKGETPLALALAPPAPIKGQSTTVQTVKWRADYAAWLENKGRTSTVDLLRKLGARQ